MEHIRHFAKTVLLTGLVFVVANHAGFSLLKAAVSGARFRALVAADAARHIPPERPVTLFIGNSRIMGGIHPGSYAGAGVSAYSLAYNGLYLDDLRLLLDAFIRTCRCRVDTVFANPDIFRERADEDATISDLQRFLSGFDPAALRHIQARDPAWAIALRLFPLLHFNNEFFLRALYYAVTGRDGQDHANDYSFRLTGEMEQRLRRVVFPAQLDIPALQDLQARLAAAGARLVVIEPPYHRVYLDSVPGFAAAQAQLAAAVQAAGVDYLDHSALFRDRQGLFADPLHLNREGQRRYSRWLRESLAPPAAR